VKIDGVAVSGPGNRRAIQIARRLPFRHPLGALTGLKFKFSIRSVGCEISCYVPQRLQRAAAARARAVRAARAAKRVQRWDENGFENHTKNCFICTLICVCNRIHPVQR
jgi:hypothetical protein